ncbi:uncharacterized protein LOC129303898 isoform X2 [Prosopis cineraria]|uniref:uncharacterized protein LOC129303898 isoform X2 n=1 Tax=Prosopis cineraria TaxID=364024 RepID=UPI00240FA884|nr:uncharacterized protein LOC129303898 isoform X2 [Prosopis cineraria]
MGSQTAMSNDRSRMNWTPLMERYFLDLMLEHLHRGNRVGHTFNKQAWNDMLTMFNTKFSSQCDKDVLKSRYATLWKQFNDVKNLLCHIGFSWDASRQMVTANDFAWDAYIKVHPDARFYRTKSVQNFDDLCVIYGSTIADGRYSLSSHDASLVDEVQSLQVGDEIRSTAQFSNEHPRLDWTAAMDQFFIELLLDQLGRGNKVDNSFSKKAWTDMLAMFNTKFGSQHGKRFLRQRYRKLLKYYCDITVFLKEGFSWDGKQQMLAADDSVWNAYVKAHPHARAYRMKTLPDYHDLELIFRSESDDVMSDLHQEKNLQDVISEINAGDGRGNQNTNGTDRTRTYWTPPMDRCLIDLLLEQVKKGNKLGQTFITQAWNDMVTSFNRRFKCYRDKDVLKNRFKHLRRQYKDIDKLLQQDGFSWDDTREMVAAEDSVWDAYTKVHPEARSLRVKTLPGFRKLGVILGEECSDKRYSLLASIADPSGELPTLITGEEKNGSFPRVYDAASIIEWTESMECCFFDLMIEQVNQGNRVGNKFNQQAWTHMIKAFSTKLGIQSDKQFLEDQYFCLMKQHSDISSLLNHDGFAWDETLQMVVAENDVWEAYIKDHPDAISYRNRFLDLYPDLCKIFGNKESGARVSTPGGIQWMEAGNITIEIDMDGTCGNLILTDNSEISCHDTERLRGKDVNRASGNSVVMSNAEIIEEDNQRPNELDLDGPSVNLAVTGNTEISDRDIERPEEIDMDGTSGNLVITANASMSGPDFESPGKLGMDGPCGYDIVTGNTDASSPHKRMLAKFNVGKTSKKLIVTGSTEIKDCGKRRRGEGLSDSRPRDKKPKKDQRIRKALSEMANAVKKLMNEKDDRSFQNALSALQAMPDIDEELVMDACDLLEDERKAKTFLALDTSLRKKWLLRKLRSQ